MEKVNSTPHKEGAVLSFEATKNLLGARCLSKAVRREYESITSYSSPAFDLIKGGKGGRSSDRVSGMLIRKEQILQDLTAVTDACLYLEEASQQELATVENLKLRSLLIYRYEYGLPWPEISKELGGRESTDALKKQFERGLKAYEDQKIRVEYSPEAKRAMEWLQRALNDSGITDTRELKKTSVDLFELNKDKPTEELAG